MLAAGALVLPWTTRLTTGAPVDTEAWLWTPMLAFTILGLLTLAALLWPTDRWLAAFVALAAGGAWRALPALETAQWIGAGALLLHAARERQAHRWIRGALVAAGALQLVVMLLQAGAPTLPGTLGNANHLGSFLAIVGPLAPWWAVPAFVAGTLATSAAAATLAVLLGLTVRWPRLAFVWVGVAAVAFVPLAAWHDPAWSTLRWRLDVWALGLRAGWDAPVLGHGLGSWFMAIPALQHRAAPSLTHGFAAHAHNEYVQLLYEGGLVALALVGGWIVAQGRRIAHSPARGAVAALAVNACAMFPFHLGPTALAAVLVLGMATAPEAECAA